MKTIPVAPLERALPIDEREDRSLQRVASTLRREIDHLPGESDLRAAYERCALSLEEAMH